MKKIINKVYSLEGKNFIWNMVGSSLNAFNSLFFMIIVVRFLNMETAGVFTLAFSLACLFCIIGNYSGRVFQVTDVKDNLNNKEYIINRIVTCILMMLFVIFFIYLNSYDNYKSIVIFLLCLFKCLEAFSEIFFGILQKNDQLYKVGLSLSIKSILSVLIFLTSIIIFKNLIFSIILINILWFLTIIFYDIPSAYVYFKDDRKIKISNVLILFKNGFFTFSFMFLSIYLVNLTKYVLDGYASSNLQAIYGIILMPATLVSLVSQYFINPYLKELSDHFKSKSFKKINRIVKKIILIILIISIFSIVGTKLFGIYILNTVYNVQINLYLRELLIVMCGATFFSINSVYSAALTTIRYTFIQLLNYIICSILGSIMATILIMKLNILGASFSYLLIMFLQFLIYTVSYSYIIRKKIKEDY